MTLNEIENSLPNGLHDAELSHIDIDYISREVKFYLKIWVGDPWSEKTELREAYRDARLTLSHFIYFVIEPPDSTYPYQKATSLRVDTGSIQTAKIATSTKLPESIPDDAFSHWFFVQEWNAFIFAAAMDARLDWKD
jgi:hypothetical protein